MAAKSDLHKVCLVAGRQVYLLSRLYNEVGSGNGKETWYSEETKAIGCVAAKGVDFLDRARDPETGHLFFSTTRDGSARLHLQRKPYSAVFYVQGMLEFWRALQTHKREAVLFPMLCLWRPEQTNISEGSQDFQGPRLLDSGSLTVRSSRYSHVCQRQR